MDSGRITWDKSALGRVLAKDAGVLAEVNRATQERCAKANALCAGFKSGVWHDHANGDKKYGPTQAVYGSNVKRFGAANVPVGIVYTANYAAAKDNLQHNTLAKVVN